MHQVTTRVSKFWFVLCICLASTVTVNAQTETLDASLPGYAPVSLAGGGAPGTFSVLIKTTSVSISGYKLKVTMPADI
jgi:hypothetical protein